MAISKVLLATRPLDRRKKWPRAGTHRKRQNCAA
jgi:hypothetical protein